jgi:hypothetical protein
MTRGKILATVLGLAGGLLLGLSAGSIAATTQARGVTVPTATGFLHLPPPPPIVGYPPQIFMNQLPPGVVRPNFGLNSGFRGPEHRHDFQGFDGSFEDFHDR